MDRKLIIYSIFILTFLATLSTATPGSLIDSVRVVVDQEPTVSKWLFEDFVFEPTGHSPRIADMREGILPEVAGRLIGPYSLWAKPKGWPGPSCFIIVIRTDVAFFDASGTKLEKPFNASTVKERFKSIEIRPIEIPDSRLSGQWHAIKTDGLMASYYKDVVWTLSRDRRLSVTTETTEGQKSYSQYYDVDQERMLVGDRERNIWSIYKYSFEGDHLLVEQSADGKLFIRFVFEKIHE